MYPSSHRPGLRVVPVNVKNMPFESKIAHLHIHLEDKMDLI